MLIPIIPKNPEADDFTCADGEIEYLSIDQSSVVGGNGEVSGGGFSSAREAAVLAAAAYGVRFRLTPQGQYPSFQIRIPLQSGDAEKAALMLGGEISRVDADSSDRIAAAITAKAADEFSRIVTDLRRQGLHLLPFRVYCMLMTSDGSAGFPTPQAVMLPSETPPHPEITASHVSSDTLTLSLTVPVRPCRMAAELPDTLDGKCQVRLFVSYPVFIPDAKEISGSLGSVRSASGGNALGVRFSFLSQSAMKWSVAAPEKYYRLYGNALTGYRMSAKAAPSPDYTVFAKALGAVAPFSPSSLIAQDSAADPFLWIADWEMGGGGTCWPLSLPYAFRSRGSGGEGGEESGGESGGEGSGVVIRPPKEADAGLAAAIAEATGWRNILLTRPMAFADAEKSRRHASRRSVRRLAVLGLPDADCVAVLLGSDNGRDYEPMRIFYPRSETAMQTPGRLLHRVLLASASAFGQLCLEVDAVTSP